MKYTECSKFPFHPKENGEILSICRITCTHYYTDLFFLNSFLVRGCPFSGRIKLYLLKKVASRILEFRRISI